MDRKMKVEEEGKKWFEEGWSIKGRNVKQRAGKE